MTGLRAGHLQRPEAAVTDGARVRVRSRGNTETGPGERFVGRGVTVVRKVLAAGNVMLARRAVVADVRPISQKR